MLIKIKSINRIIKLMKHNSVRCDFCKFDINRASQARHLKSKKHSEKFTQIKVIIPRKDPTERVVKEENKVSDNDTQFGNQYSFTGRILKVSYAITGDNHHDKNANSQIIIISNIKVQGLI